MVPLLKSMQVETSNLMSFGPIRLFHAASAAHRW